MPSESGSDRPMNVAADRVLMVLSAFRGGRDDELGVTELSDQLSLDKSVVYRILHTLAEHRFVERDPKTRRYRVGLGAWEVGQRYTGGTRLEDAAVPLLTPLVNQSGGTGYVATLDGTDAVYLALINGPGALRVHVDVGSRVPAHTIAAGKAMLARLPEDDLRTRLRRVRLAQVTDSTVTSVDDLLQELEVARRVGYALNHGEYMPGVAGVGAAVRDRDPSSIAGISVAFPMLPSFAGLLETLPAEVRGVAEEISRQLHGTRTPVGIDAAGT